MLGGNLRSFLYGDVSVMLSDTSVLLLSVACNWCHFLCSSTFVCVDDIKLSKES